MSPTTDGSGRPLRADAQRNRDRILTAARTTLLADGTMPPMEEIAYLAGVGVGTLYRRFPDRHALLQAVAEDSIGHLTLAGRTAWNEEPDAWSALCRFLRSGGDHRLALSVVRPNLLDTVHERPGLVAAGQEWFDLLATMVDHAQAAGAMRTDVGPGDVALLLGQVTRPVPGLAAGIADALPDRFLDVMLDGLRARTGTPLPGRPLGSWWTTH